jgi:uncharacterized protein (DUF1800 family)
MTPEAISDSEAVRRLLERVGLGPRAGEQDRAAGFDATLDTLLTPPGAPDPGAIATPAPQFGPPVARVGKAATVEARRQRLQAAAAQAQQLATWWLDRLVAAQAPFAERMVWFWHGHFATSVQKVRSAQLMYRQNDTFRTLGRGDFRLLAQAMLTDPAMLLWLDGAGSNAEHPNENLAREFMERFSLGLGNYTEDDVRQAARALTGWRVDAATSSSSFVAAAHDPGPETVLSTTGSYDAPGFADVVLHRPASPRFLAGRIWTRFVSDSPPDPVTLDRLIAAYGPGHDVSALVRAAVTSPGFRDPSSALVKEPVLWLVASLRALGVAPSALPPGTVRSALTGLGQVPLAPPNVGGWPAGTSWLTTAAALSRLRAARAIAAVADLGPVSSVAPSGRIEATAALLGLPGFTDRTAAALRPSQNRPRDLVALALASPEYTVSA